jgi:hypothetical protein
MPNNVSAGSSLFAPHSTIANLWVALTDSTDSNYIILARCTGTPDTTTETFAHGCLMIRTDSGTGTNAIYENTGSAAAPVWELLNTSGGASYSVAVARTNGTTPVSFFGATNNFNGTIKAVEVISQDDANGTISVATDSGVTASIVKGSINSVRGSGTSVNNTFTSTGSLTTVSDAASGNATVLVFFTTT